MRGIGKLKALERDFAASDESMPTSTYLQDVDSTELYKKILRIKAYKASVWLSAEDSLFRAFLCVTVIGKFEHIMHRLMAWQRDDTILTKFPPLVQMLHSEDSPVLNALRCIKDLMTTGHIMNGCPLTLQDILRRFLADLKGFRNVKFVCLQLNSVKKNSV